MDKVVIPRREVSLRMLVFSLLCVAIASSFIAPISAAENDEDGMFGSNDQSRVSQLGSAREENLNCFLQFDQFLANEWTTRLGLETPLNSGGASLIINRLKEDEELSSQRIILDDLGNCMGNLTKKLKNPGLEKCMTDLTSTEIQNDAFLSVPELFDNTLPLSFLTFLDIRELAKVLYQNRSWDELNQDEINVFQVASSYLRKDKSGQDKVFVLDQACEWKNLAALREHREDLDNMLNEFKQQVIRSISIQIAQEIFAKGDLKPGTWIHVYRRWIPIRLQNLKELESSLKALRKQRFTIEELCGYATTLGNFFAEEELKILLPKKVSPLHLNIGDLKDKSNSKKDLLCSRGATGECENFKKLKGSYEMDLRCMWSFGELLSNHIMYSMVQPYANIEPRITYPEIVCKKHAPTDKIAIRYCRCIGSFCTFREVGDIKANIYKLINDTVTRA